jgi:formylmethanofuran dehydrogenase subunit C
LGCIACVGLLKDSENELNAVNLVLKEQSAIPIEADSICPDLFVGRSQSEIEALPVFYGRRKVTLGDLFRVEGDRSDHVVVRGYLQHVKHIGQGMSGGLITVHSDVGMHLGAKMSGGAIIVHGNADAWAGAHMSGGVIQVHGNAGAMLGAAYAGERRGMRGGMILVEGDVGPRAGERMRRGLIAVQGNVGEFAGARMIAGSLVVFGTLGARAGAGMKRGTIVALGGLADGLLPIFRYNCSYRPAFLRVYLRRLGEWGFPVTSEQIEGVFHRYAGDITTLGKGEILVNDQHQ